MADVEAALNASRALAQSLAAERGLQAAGWLKERAPHRNGTHERLAEMLVECRAWGIDVGAAVRLAETRIAQLGLDVDVPVLRLVRENTDPTTASHSLADTGSITKDD